MKFGTTVLILLIFLIFPSLISAVTLDILSAPESISTEEFTVNVSIDGPNPAINYLQIALYKEGSDKYFGETYNGSEWYSGSEKNKYYAIEIPDSKIATASIQARFGNPNTSQYSSPGNYKLKVKRYTASGSFASNDEQTQKDIQITVVLPSPTPTPDPTPNADPSPTPKSSLSPTPKSTPKTSLKPSQKNSPSFEPSGEVLSEITPSISPAASALGESTKSGSIKFPMGILFVGAGIVLSGGAGFLAYKQSLKQKFVE